MSSSFKHSGLQKQVISVYRKLLRVASSRQDQGLRVHLQQEFRTNATLPKKEFMKVRVRVRVPFRNRFSGYFERQNSAYVNVPSGSLGRTRAQMLSTFPSYVTRLSFLCAKRRSTWICSRCRPLREFRQQLRRARGAQHDDNW